MRKYVIFLILALIPIVSNAKMTEWKEVQSVVVPVNTPVYYKFTEKGNIQYFLKLEQIGNVTVSMEPTKFKYTVRQYKPAQSNIDLRDVFGAVQKDDFGHGVYFDTVPHNEFPGKRYSLLIK